MLVSEPFVKWKLLQLMDVSESLGMRERKVHLPTYEGV
jgi:hypothetical protein